MVHLRWTVPSESTDDLPLTRKHGSGPLRAEVCRAEGSVACMPIRSMPVVAGTMANTEDTLPETLASGLLRPLQYRIVLRNAAGHAAESVPVAITAGGKGLAALAALSAESRADGVHLHWTPAPDRAELTLERHAVPQRTGPDQSQRTGPDQKSKAAADQTLAVKADKGGALDALAPTHGTYEYTVGRVEHLQMAGQTVDLRGTPATVIVDRQSDAFPPAIPRGLVALEIAASSQAAGNTTSPAGDASAVEEVNLSWQPNTEPDLQGYLVYRIEANGTGAPQRLTATPTSTLSYDDFSAKPGVLYRYSVSAVNTSGKESERSAYVSSR